MSHKTRIAILGIGGVGGYFGGLLAEKYFHSDTVEIIFFGKKFLLLGMEEVVTVLDAFPCASCWYSKLDV